MVRPSGRNAMRAAKRSAGAGGSEPRRSCKAATLHEGSSAGCVSSRVCPAAQQNPQSWAAAQQRTLWCLRGSERVGSCTAANALVVTQWCALRWFLQATTRQPPASPSP